MAMMKAILTAVQTNLPVDNAASASPTSFYRMLGSWASVRVQFELALLNSYLVQSSWTIETYTGHEAQWQARRAVLLLLLQHRKTRAAFVSCSSKDPVVADLETVGLIDEAFALAGKMLKTEADSPSWSGHDSGDFEFRVKTRPDSFDLNESPNDVKYEPLKEMQRSAIIGSGLMDLELAPIHSVLAEVKWAAEQAKENEENEEFFKSHVRWLYFQVRTMALHPHLPPHSHLISSVFLADADEGFKGRRRRRDPPRDIRASRGLCGQSRQWLVVLVTPKNGAAKSV